MHFQLKTLSLSGFAFVLALLVGLAPRSYANTNTLTLDQLAERVINNNPLLAEHYWRQQAEMSRIGYAELGQPLEVTVDVNNAIGTGNYSNFDRAEVMIALSSVIEMGDKAQLRVDSVNQGVSLIEAQREAALYDLIGQATQLYIALLSLQEQQALLQQQVAFFTENVATIATRVNRGAAPTADLIRARAELADAQLTLHSLRARHEDSKLRLAAFWGSSEVDFATLEGSLYQFRPVESFDTLYQRTLSSPYLAALSANTRLQEAQARLVQAQGNADIQWSAGVTQYFETDDTALGLTVSIPLLSEQRSASRQREQAALTTLAEVSQQTATLQLSNNLRSAYQLREHYYQAATMLQHTVLPLREEALEATRTAYESGYYSYTDWLNANTELFAAQLALIKAASGVLQQHTLVEQISGQTVYAVSNNNEAQHEGEQP